jgi:hypothetical protein
MRIEETAAWPPEVAIARSILARVTQKYTGYKPLHLDAFFIRFCWTPLYLSALLYKGFRNFVDYSRFLSRKFRFPFESFEYKIMQLSCYTVCGGGNP